MFVRGLGMEETCCTLGRGEIRTGEGGGWGVGGVGGMRRWWDGGAIIFSPSIPCIP